MYSGSMSDDDKSPRPPQFIGVKPSPDAVVDSYAEGLRKRRKARQEAERAKHPKIPNLTQANQQYDPRKERPMTLNEIAHAQENMSKVVKGEKKAQLGEETIRGLHQIKEYADKERARMGNNEPEKPVETQQPAEQPSKKPEKKPISQDEANEILGGMDDMELELLMERVRSDVINNEQQRRAIKERVKPIDLADGLATGEFRQVVPIKPDTLEVEYRTVSQMENDHFRRIIFNWNAEDARAVTLSSERFGLMQTVAAIIRINGTALPKHLDADGNGSYKFLEEQFLAKYRLISSYPAPLIHALGTHAYWFDQRVRELFTTETLKNG